MDPLILLRWPLAWLNWWIERIGVWGVAAMFAAGVVLALIVSCTT